MGREGSGHPATCPWPVFHCRALLPLRFTSPLALSVLGQSPGNPASHPYGRALRPLSIPEDGLRGKEWEKPVPAPGDLVSALTWTQLPLRPGVRQPPSVGLGSPPPLSWGRPYQDGGEDGRLYDPPQWGADGVPASGQGSGGKVGEAVLSRGSSRPLAAPTLPLSP